MKTVNLTDFRSHASTLLTEVENGETLLVLRHGKPIAEVSPVEGQGNKQLSWKRPALRLTTKGLGLSSAIVEERNDESLS